MEFLYQLQEPLFSYYMDTYEAEKASRWHPAGSMKHPTELDLNTLLYDTNCVLSWSGDREETEEFRDHIVHIEVGKETVSRLEQFPHIQRVTYKDKKSTVFPKELATHPGLRVLELYETSKYHKFHKNFRLATQLEALLLTLVHNIKDISDIKALEALRYVHIYNTIKLKEYTPLQTLPRLSHLSMYSVEMEDISPAIQGLERLEMLELKSCVYWEPQIPHLIDILKAQPGLKQLGLQGAELSGQPIPRMAQVEALDLDGAEDLHPDFSLGFPRLKALSWKHYKESSLPSRLESLKGLEQLRLSLAQECMNDDVDLSAFGELTALTHLDVSNNRLGRVPASFAALKNLTQLKIDGNGLKDASALQGLPSLQTVSLEAIEDQDHAAEVIMSLPSLEQVQVCDGFDLTRLVDHPRLRLIVCSEPTGKHLPDLFHRKESAHYPKRGATAS